MHYYCYPNFLPISLDWMLSAEHGAENLRFREEDFLIIQILRCLWMIDSPLIFGSREYWVIILSLVFTSIRSPLHFGLSSDNAWCSLRSLLLPFARITSYISISSIPWDEYPNERVPIDVDMELGQPVNNSRGFTVSRMINVITSATETGIDKSAPSIFVLLKQLDLRSEQHCSLILNRKLFSFCHFKLNSLVSLRLSENPGTLPTILLRYDHGVCEGCCSTYSYWVTQTYQSSHWYTFESEARGNSGGDCRGSELPWRST